MTDSPLPQPPTEKSYSWLAKLLRPKVAISALVVLLLLMSPFIIRGWFLSQVPDAGPPFDQSKLTDLEIPDEQNAFVEYREATSLLPPKIFNDYAHEAVLNHGWALVDPKTKQKLRDNFSALEVWREGTRKTNALNIPPEEMDINVSLQTVQQMRALTRLALLQAERETHQTSPEHAWPWYRASIRASRHIGRTGNLIERLVGSACFAMTLAEIDEWASDPRLIIPAASKGSPRSRPGLANDRENQHLPEGRIFHIPQYHRADHRLQRLRFTSGQWLRNEPRSHVPHRRTPGEPTTGKHLLPQRHCPRR